MRSAANVLEKLGVVTTVASAVMRLLAILAAQAPSSPWRIGLFEGPLESTALTLLFTGVVAIFAVRIDEHAVHWRTVGCTLAGVGLVSTTGVIGATTGMIGAQAFDPRPGAVGLFVVRVAGDLLLTLGLVFWMVARRRNGSES